MESHLSRVERRFRISELFSIHVYRHDKILEFSNRIETTIRTLGNRKKSTYFMLFNSQRKFHEKI